MRLGVDLANDLVELGAARRGGLVALGVDNDELAPLLSLFRALLRAMRVRRTSSSSSSSRSRRSSRRCLLGCLLATLARHGGRV